MLERRSYSVLELEKHSGFDRRTIVYYIQQGLLARAGRRGPNTRYPDSALDRLLFIKGVKDLQERGGLLNFTLADIRHALELSDPEKLRELISRGFPVEDVEPLLSARAVASALPEPPEPEASSSSPRDAGSVPARQAQPGGGVQAQPASDNDKAARMAPTELHAGTPALVAERRAFGLADASVRSRFAPGHRDSAAGAGAETGTGNPPAAGVEDAAMISGLGEMLRQLEIRPAMSGRRLPAGASEQWTEIPITSRVYLSVRGLGVEDAPLADAVARALKKLLRS